MPLIEIHKTLTKENGSPKITDLFLLYKLECPFIPNSKTVLKLKGGQEIWWDDIRYIEYDEAHDKIKIQLPYKQEMKHAREFHLNNGWEIFSWV